VPGEPTIVSAHISREILVPADLDDRPSRWKTAPSSITLTSVRLVLWRDVLCRESVTRP